MFILSTVDGLYKHQVRDIKEWTNRSKAGLKPGLKNPRVKAEPLIFLAMH